MKTKAEIENYLGPLKIAIQQRYRNDYYELRSVINALEWVLSPSEKKRKKAKGRKAE